MKKLCTAKEIMIGMKIQLIEWKKIVVYHTSDDWPVFMIYKLFAKLKNTHKK